ncbi:hypothetical protein L3K78_16190, partial [Oscillospiraceae bacterium SCCA1]|nr:hypothetical protein [Oscillospiraceae bacterium SCCA1]
NALLETFGGTAGIRDDGFLVCCLNASFCTFLFYYLFVLSFFCSPLPCRHAAAAGAVLKPSGGICAVLP